MDKNGIKPYLLIEELLKERSNLTLASLCEGKLDLKKTRDITTKLYKYDPKAYPFNIYGTDSELWLSVKDFFDQ